MEAQKRPKFLPVKRSKMDPRAKLAEAIALGLNFNEVVDLEEKVNSVNFFADALYKDWELRGWLKKEDEEDDD